MWENRQISCAEFQIIYVDRYFVLKEVQHNSLPLKYGLCLVTSKNAVWKRGKEGTLYSGETWQILPHPGDEG